MLPVNGLGMLAVLFLVGLEVTQPAMMTGSAAAGAGGPLSDWPRSSTTSIQCGSPPLVRIGTFCCRAPGREDVGAYLRLRGGQGSSSGQEDGEESGAAGEDSDEAELEAIRRRMLASRMSGRKQAHEDDEDEDEGKNSEDSSLEEIRKRMAAARVSAPAKEDARPRSESTHLSVPERLERSMKEYASMEKAQDKLQEAFSKLTAQQTENNLVQKELDLVKSDSKVYKLTGPLLMRQSLAESKEQVKKRLAFISEEIKRSKAKIQDVAGGMEQARPKILELQQQVRMMQERAR